MPGQIRKGRATSRLTARRRADLVDFVQEHGHATVGMLVEALDVSGDTVRSRPSGTSMSRASSCGPMAGSSGEMILPGLTVRF